MQSVIYIGFSAGQLSWHDFLFYQQQLDFLNTHLSPFSPPLNQSQALPSTPFPSPYVSSCSFPDPCPGAFPLELPSLLPAESGFASGVGLLASADAPFED